MFGGLELAVFICIRFRCFDFGMKSSSPQYVFHFVSRYKDETLSNGYAFLFFLFKVSTLVVGHEMEHGLWLEDFISFRFMLQMECTNLVGVVQCSITLTES